MKKLSISLFAVLAIVFAVASAFSTAKVSTVLSPGYHLAVEDRNISGYTFAEADFDAALLGHTPTSSDCGTVSAKICAVNIDNSNNPAGYTSGGIK